MGQKGSSFFGNFVTVLKTGVISFGVFVLNVSETGIAFGGVNIDNIIGGNIGNFGDKNFEIKKVKNDWNADKGNQTVNAGLAENGKSVSDCFGKISDSLDCLVTLLFVFGFKTKKEELVNRKFDFKNEVLDFVDRNKTGEIIKKANEKDEQEMV